MPADRLAPRPASLVAAMVTATAVWLATPAWAGGGPETTIVVVNADSPTSWRIANEYVKRRQIPATHVCAIEGVGTLQIVSVETFRSKLWAPVKAFLEKNGFADEIDVIAWSADFPYGVDFDADKPTKELSAPWTPIASLTSMTYFARHVEAKDADAYLSPSSNGYYRRAGDEPAAARSATPEEVAAHNEAEAAIAKKKYAEAAKAFERLLATYKQSGVAYYNYACCLARLGRADEAMKALEAASAAGWNSAGTTEEDADLESLRGRDDFKALVERMKSAAGAAVQPTRGFRGRYAWTGAAEPETQPAADSRQRYFLSTMLAYTGEWGNSTPEALAALSMAADSDGTNPDGTFYFLVNGDIRAKTREPLFDAAVATLKAMGRKAEILTADKDGQNGVVPCGKVDVLGAVMGTAGFSWASGKSRVMPGAVCEHLTSFGAVFNQGSQTKLSELIRAGAAGASGTVYEPYALQWKFPVPYLHVHYAAGCSLSEAFYQSVAGPYQLLIVGDPLARPFARFAKLAPMTFAGPLSGTTTIDPHVDAAPDRALADMELWVDGALVAHAKPRTPFSWDTTTVEDGAHEIRVVAVEDGPIATRSSAPTWVTIANGKAAATIAARQSSVALDGRVALAGRAPGAKAITVLSGTRVLAQGKVMGDSWSAEVAAAALGLGATTLQARATREGGTGFRSPFLPITVGPPTLRKAIGAAKPPSKPPKPSGGKKPPAAPAPATPAATDGLVCTLQDARGKPARPPFVLGSLGGSGVEAPRKAIEDALKLPIGLFAEVRIAGEFEAGPSDGLYQFDITANGVLSIDVDGEPLLAPTPCALDRMRFALAHLEKGWHSIAIRYTPSGAPDLTILLAGDRVASPMAGKSLRHGSSR